MVGVAHVYHASECETVMTDKQGARGLMDQSQNTKQTAQNLSHNAKRTTQT